MATNQPFGNEPQSPDEYVIDETTDLGGDIEDREYEYWQFDVADEMHLRGRAIARGGERIEFLLVGGDEFEFYERGDNFWVETRAGGGSSIRIDEVLTAGEYALVVQAETGEDEESPLVTVQVWEEREEEEEEEEP